MKVAFPELETSIDLQFSENAMTGMLAVAGEPVVAFSLRLTLPESVESLTVVESCSPLPGSRRGDLEPTRSRRAVSPTRGNREGRQTN